MISNPSRPLAAAPGAVKVDLARYYEAVADAFVPQIAKRPLALVKCPGGDFEHCFFQKHAGDPRRAAQRPADDPPYMRLPTLRSAIEAVQNGAIEFHAWQASFPRLDRPTVSCSTSIPMPASRGRNFASPPISFAGCSSASG